MENKKAALELSVGTIVVVVLAMTMLILGVVLVRSIMCGAINLTGGVNKQVEKELGKIFESSESEFVCIGSGSEAITLIPGQTNIIYCAARAPVQAVYSTELVSITSITGVSSSATLESWIPTAYKTWQGTISPADDIAKKIISINIPKTAPEENIRIKIRIKKDTQIISEQDLDFQVKRTGWFKSTVC